MPKPGTFNRWTAGSTWTNYSVTTELTSSDNDTLGVMFRYTNATNYYRFAMDSERTQRRLTKVRNGTWTTLWSDSTAYQLNRTYVLELIANGSTLTVKLDGVQLWSGTDTNALTTGTVAMYSWQNTGARFDNVLVRNLSVPLSSITEPKRGFDRLRADTTFLANMERTPKPIPPRAPTGAGRTSPPLSGDTVTLSFPLWKGTSMRSLLFTDGTELTPRYSDSTHQIDFIQLVPLFESELRYKKSNGEAALWRKFEEQQVPYWSSVRNAASI